MFSKNYGAVQSDVVPPNFKKSMLITLDRSIIQNRVLQAQLTELEDRNEELLKLRETLIKMEEVKTENVMESRGQTFAPPSVE